MHNPYEGNDDMMIEDGTELSITHSGSTILPFLLKNFKLENVLCVPNMKQTLISIHQFCSSNNIAIEFLTTGFLVKDLSTGSTLLRGRNNGGVYEWPKSKPILVFSSIKTTFHVWHHRLGRPSIPILKHMVSSHNLCLTSYASSSFDCNTCLSNKSHQLTFSQSTIKSTRPLEIIYSDV